MEIFELIIIFRFIVAAPTLAVFSSVLRTRGRSRDYYLLCLVSLLAWTISGAVLTNINISPVAADILARHNSIAVALAVFFFVMSSIYFTRRPSAVEMAALAIPIFIAIAAGMNSYELILTPYGWGGDISNPALRYSWLAALNVVMIYALARLYSVRKVIRDPNLQRRLRFFMTGAATALVVGVLLYLLTQVDRYLFHADIPSFSSIGVNLSFLIAYPAFSKRQLDRT